MKTAVEIEKMCRTLAEYLREKGELGLDPFIGGRRAKEKRNDT